MASYLGVGSHGNMHADQDQGCLRSERAAGAALWTFKAQGEVFNGPALSHRVYFLTAAGIVYGLQ